MSLSWQTVSVFVSSTFNDMHAERDYLVKRVFPELREWCEQRKLRLIDIDLRWGITEADATNKNVVKVCLEHIDKCRPFFLCFLGQRRGWVPEKSEIAPDTCNLYPDLKKFIGEASVTEMEILHSVVQPLNNKERADRSFFYLRDRSYLDELPKEPLFVRNIYTNEGIADSFERERADDQLKIWRKYTIPATCRPVHTYSATWNPNESTPELALPLQCPSRETGKQNKWRNQWRQVGIDPPDFDLDDDSPIAQDARNKNREITKGRLGDFRCEDRDLAEIVLDDLKSAISERFPEHLPIQSETLLQKELDQQEQFLELNCQGFIERKGDFDLINRYIESGSQDLFVITAPGGMGKTMFLANWIHSFQQKYDSKRLFFFRFIGASDRSTTVDSLLRSLLEEIREKGLFEEEIPLDPTELRNKLQEILATIGLNTKIVLVIDALNQLATGLQDIHWLPRTLPPGIQMVVSFKRDGGDAENLAIQLQRDLPETFTSIRPFESRDDRKKLVSAYLDQYLKQLDEQLVDSLIDSPGASNPLYLKIVLSEIRVYGSFENLRHKIRSDFGETPVEAFIGLLRRLESDPAYSSIEPKVAVPFFFGLISHARRGLSEEELISLFLKEWNWKNTKKRKEQLKDTIRLFLRQVYPFFALRQGQHDFFYESFRLAAIERYENREKSDCKKWNQKSSTEWHQLLANYFNGLDNWQKKTIPTETDNDNIRIPVYRKISELPYHQTYGKQWSKLKKTLTDLDFIEAKCSNGMVYDLIDDYNRIFPTWLRYGPAIVTAKLYKELYGIQCPFCSLWSNIQKENLGKIILCSNCGEKLRINRFFLASRWYLSRKKNKRKKFQIRRKYSFSPSFINFADFITIHASILTRFPDLTFQLAANQPHNSAVAKKANIRWQMKLETRPWLFQKEDSKNSIDPLLTECLGHRGQVFTCLFCPDGLRIISGSKSGEILIWDSFTGKIVDTFNGHSNSVCHITVSPDGMSVLSSSWDSEILLWDVYTHRIISNINKEKAFFACNFSPDGKFIVIGSSGQLFLYRIKNMKLVKTYGKRRHLNINACMFSPDGKFIIAGFGNNNFHAGYLTVFNRRTANILCDINFDNPVICCQCSPDGNRIIASGIGGVLGGDEVEGLWGPLSVLDIFDIENQTNKSCEERFQYGIYNRYNPSKPLWITACSFSPDGYAIALGTASGHLLIVDAENYSLLGTIRGHNGRISACNFSPDGMRIVTSSFDHTVKIWDVNLLLKIKKSRFTISFGYCAVVCHDGTWCAYPYDWGFWTINIKTKEKHKFFYDTGISAFFSPDCELLFYIFEWGKIFVTEIRANQIAGNELLTIESEIFTNKNINNIIFSPDGALAIISFSGKSVLYDIENKKEINILSNDRNGQFCFSADGRLIFGCYSKSNIVTILANSGDFIDTFYPNTDECHGLIASKDGRKLFVVKENFIEVHDTKNGTLITKIYTGGSEISYSFSPKGTRLFKYESSDEIFTRSSHTLEIFDTSTGNEITRYYFRSNIIGVHDNGDTITVIHTDGISTFSLMGINNEYPIFTPIRYYRKQKKWDNQIIGICPICGYQFKVPSTILNKIKKINRNDIVFDCIIQIHSEELWEDPELFLNCPHCNKQLQTNSFLIDQKMSGLSKLP